MGRSSGLTGGETSQKRGKEETKQGKPWRKWRPNREVIGKVKGYQGVTRGKTGRGEE